MITLLYIIMYFIFGFVVASLKKAYDETYSINDIKTSKHYALLGMLWLPSVILWITVFTIVYIYELFKSKL